ncbi:MAG: hypothetical protein D6726_01740 [Nitrospirae bacterium]|nr:MAG: hypothetical protein D6726_01740 [Nitrospirota bacterium]
MTSGQTSIYGKIQELLPKRYKKPTTEDTENSEDRGFREISMPTAYRTIGEVQKSHEKQFQSLTAIVFRDF